MLLRNFPFQWVLALIFTIVIIYLRLRIDQLEENYRSLRTRHTTSRKHTSSFPCAACGRTIPYQRVLVENNVGNLFVLPDDAIVQAQIDIRNGARGTVQTRDNGSLDDVVMIYNRVPKTASTSFVGLVYDLCKQNKYHVLHINVTNNMHTLTLANQVLRSLYFYKNIRTQCYSTPIFVYYSFILYFIFKKCVIIYFDMHFGKDTMTTVYMRKI